MSYELYSVNKNDLSAQCIGIKKVNANGSNEFHHKRLAIAYRHFPYALDSKVSKEIVNNDKHSNVIGCANYSTNFHNVYNELDTSQHYKNDHCNNHNWCEIIKIQNAKGQAHLPRNTERRVVCRHYLQGVCNRGVCCRFLHPNGDHRVIVRTSKRNLHENKHVPKLPEHNESAARVAKINSTLAKTTHHENDKKFGEQASGKRYASLSQTRLPLLPTTQQVVETHIVTPNNTYNTKLVEDVSSTYMSNSTTSITSSDEHTYETLSSDSYNDNLYGNHVKQNNHNTFVSEAYTYSFAPLNRCGY